MRYFFLSLCLATPALAHPIDASHTHDPVWAEVIGAALMGIAVFTLCRRLLLVR